MRAGGFAGADITAVLGWRLILEISSFSRGWGGETRVWGGHMALNSDSETRLESRRGLQQRWVETTQDSRVGSQWSKAGTSYSTLRDLVLITRIPLIITVLWSRELSPDLLDSYRLFQQMGRAQILLLSVILRWSIMILLLLSSDSPVDLLSLRILSRISSRQKNVPSTWSTNIWSSNSLLSR